MKKYVINLDKRPDRWEYIQQEFKRVGIKNYERFPAIELPQQEGTPFKVTAHKACVESHAHVLNLGLAYNTFAVFEDDCSFLKGWYDTYKKAMRQLPLCWDMLYLGSTLTKDLNRYSPSLFRIKGGWTTHAIIWNNQNGVVDYALNHIHDAKNIDVYFTQTVQEKFNCFIVYPMAVTQKDGHSDIINKQSSYHLIQEYYNKHTNG